jgi:hypothetical protein
MMEKEVTEVERRLLIRKRYLEKTNSYISSEYIDQKDIYILVRDLFSEFLKIDYAFTYEELSSELNKLYIKPDLKKDIDDFLFMLSQSEYFLGNDLEQKDIRDILATLKSLIQKLIVDDSEKMKKSFFSRIFHIRGNDLPINAAVSVNPLKSIEKELPQNTPLQETREKSISMSQDENKHLNDNTFNNIGILTALPDTQKNINLIDNKNISSKPSGLQPKNTPFEIISDVHTIPKNENVMLSFSSNIPIVSMPPSQTKKQDVKTAQNKDTHSDKDELNISKDSKLNAKLNLKIQSASDKSIIIEDNSPKIIKIREYIEESYNNLSSGKRLKAKLSYDSAIKEYKNINLTERQEVYMELYELFLRLSKK